MRTVFGPVDARPALVLRVEDDEGASGWGEIWCNFPQPGAEYRARLAALVIPGALAGLDISEPQSAFATLRQRLNRLALQAGEPGPADQIASGLDIALHDLAARRRGVPLATYLGGGPRPLEPYASGIDSRLAGDMMAAARADGYRRFKLRIGFGRDSDAKSIAAAQSALQDQEQLMVDANQNWDLDEALAMARILDEAPLGWLEEPLPVDRPDREWQALADATRLPIAGGENLRSALEFDDAISGQQLRIIQPDICKWGGLSICTLLARRIIAAGKRYCPHYLGGGVGLAASAHLLAAVGGDGLLEVDVNDNALREGLAGPLLPLRDGMVHIPDAPGLGYIPDVAGIADMRVLHLEATVGA